MKIEITDIKDNKSVPLLAEIIKISQNEIDTLKDSLSTMRSKKENLERKVSSFLEETNVLFERKASTLEDATDMLKKNVTSMRSEKETLEGKVSSFLEETNVLFERKASTLEDVNSQVELLTHSILNDKLNTFVLLLNNSIKELKEDSWKDFITNIVSGLSDTLKSTDNTANTLFNIQEKNGWLTKIASLYWWSNESHVKNFVPSCYDQDSIFNYMFMNFISYLKSRDIQINLPAGDFSSKVAMYKPDYDEETSYVKKLFPQYKPDGFMLCEISFLSVNDNTGKCIGIR